MAKPHVADAHDVIRVHGARENNLKDISIALPKRRLTVFTGVSGSGKTSLVFGTIAAESQRLINETYSAFVQGFMPTLPRPEVDLLDGLTTAIIVDQQRMGGDVRSTVGTATDANAMLRILFSRLGKPHLGPPSAFAFNLASVRATGAITVERGNRRAVRAEFNRTATNQTFIGLPRRRVARTFASSAGKPPFESFDRFWILSVVFRPGGKLAIAQRPELPAQHPR